MAWRKVLRKDWGILLGLLGLAAFPFIFGIVRMIDMAQGELDPEFVRFLTSPLPIVVHIVSSGLFSVVGALQFAPTFRRQSPAWHRRAGQVLVISGIVSALTGLWMNQFYVLPERFESPILHGFRLFFGVAMLVCIVLGYTKVRSKNVMEHRIWMIRAYAIGAGTNSMPFVGAVWIIVFRQPEPFEPTENAMLVGASWIINLCIVEWFMHRSRRRLAPAAASA